MSRDLVEELHHPLGGGVIGCCYLLLISQISQKQRLSNLICLRDPS